MTLPLASVTFKMASTRKVSVEERRMKISNFSRIYFSDFLHLMMLSSLLSWKTSVWAFFSDETSSGVMRFKDFFLSSSKSSEQSYRRSHFKGPMDVKNQEFRHINCRFIKGHTRFQLSELSSSLQSQWIQISIPSKFTSCTSNNVNSHKQTTQESKVTRKMLPLKVSRGCKGSTVRIKGN